MAGSEVVQVRIEGLAVGAGDRMALRGKGRSQGFSRAPGVEGFKGSVGIQDDDMGKAAERATNSVKWDAVRE
jgi:hypothetical protein